MIILIKLYRKLASPYLSLRDHFVERKLDALNEEERFSLIYKAGYWKGVGEGSRSGEGSSMDSTAMIRQSLPAMLQRRGVRSMLDVPCGDWYWMSKIDLGDISYIGGDIVEDLAKENQRRYGRQGREFRKINLIADKLPKVDLIFVRDCLVHLTPEQIQQCVRNVVKSGSTYFATTTYTNVTENMPPVLKDRWRPLNMMRPPYSFPEPAELLDDWSDSNPVDECKFMGVWRVADMESKLAEHTAG